MNEPNLATKNTVLIVSFEERNEAKKAAGKLENGENALGFSLLRFYRVKQMPMHSAHFAVLVAAPAIGA